MEQSKLENVKQEKYLGVIINNFLCANLKRHFLQKNLRTCNSDIKRQCYKIYVRSIIEYASSA